VNEHQRLFLVQARSGFGVFELLRKQPAVAEGRVRGGTGRGAAPPHPPLRGTFSLREKGFCPLPAGEGGRRPGEGLD